MIEQLKQTGIPEQYLSLEICPKLKRIFDNNTLTIKDFLFKKEDLAIIFTDKKEGPKNAMQIASAIFRAIIKNKFPLKRKIKYIDCALLSYEIQRRIDNWEEIKDSDFLIFDNLFLLDAFDLKLITPLISYRKKWELKSIYIIHKGINEITQQHPPLKMILTDLLTINF